MGLHADEAIKKIIIEIEDLRWQTAFAWRESKKFDDEIGIVSGTTLALSSALSQLKEALLHCYNAQIAFELTPFECSDGPAVKEMEEALEEWKGWMKQGEKGRVDKT